MYCSLLWPPTHIYISNSFLFSRILIRLLSSTVNLWTLLTTENVVPFSFRFVAMPYLSRVLVHNHVFWFQWLAPRVWQSFPTFSLCKRSVAYLNKSEVHIKKIKICHNHILTSAAFGPLHSTFIHCPLYVCWYVIWQYFVFRFTPCFTIQALYYSRLHS
jgi:hypothetical protein